MGKVALPSGSRALLDSMCFIYAVEKVPPYRDILQPVLDDVAAGRLQCTVSVLALAEVLSKPLRDGDAALADRFRDLLTGTSGVALVPIDRAVAERAADVRARYNLRTPDALHVATAIEAGCTHILTNDSNWQRVTECQVIVLDQVAAQP